MTRTRKDKGERHSSSPSSSIIYLKHANLEDMLKVILYAAESPLGLIPMLYHIKYNNQDIIFTESGALGTIVSYIIQDKEPDKKWIELKRLTGEYTYVDKIGDDSRSLYIPILRLEDSTFTFPL